MTPRYRHILPIIVAVALVLAPALLAQAPFWRQTSGPEGGFFTSLASAPDGHLFASTFDRLFRSSDNGRTWSDTRLSPTPITVTSIVATEHAVVAATEKGLYRSVDDGATWTLVLQSTIYHGLELVATAPGEPIYAHGWDGFFRSLDDGATWTSLVSEPFGEGASALGVDSSGRVFIGAKSGDFGGAGEIYRSLDRGASWSKSTVASIDGVGNVLTFVFDANGTAWAGTRSAHALRSTDSGATWSVVGSPRYIPLSAANGYVYAADDGAGAIARSSDNGATWITTAFLPPDAPIVAVTPAADGDLVLAARGIGIFRSSNAGDEWEASSSGLAGQRVGAVVAAREYMVASTLFGLARSSDNGASWQRVLAMEFGMESTALALAPNGTLFAGIGTEVYRSTNDGVTWRRAGLDLPGSPVRAFASFGNEIYAALHGDGIFRSTDDGDTWDPYHGGLQGTLLNGLAVNDRGDLYAATRNGVFFTRRGDTSWQRTGEEGPEVTAIVWLGGDRLAAGTEDGVAITTDGGATWSAAATVGAQSDLVSSFTVDRRGALVVGLDGGGVARSSDNGTSWQLLNDGLHNIAVTALGLDSAGHLLAGTRGSGVFRSLGSTSRVELSRDASAAGFFIESIEPNPASQRATLFFETALQSSVRVSIHDTHGRIVSNPIDGSFDAGRHSASLDVSALPSGVYYCRILVAGHSITRAFVVRR